MTSFQISLSPKRRASGRFVSRVRQNLQKALVEEKIARGMTQSELARLLDIHRSVVSRELRGRSDITLGRVGELAWALGREIKFDLVCPTPPVGMNYDSPVIPPKIEPSFSSTSTPLTLDTNIFKLTEPAFKQTEPA